MKKTALVLIAVLHVTVFAASSELKVQSDLVVHPGQIAKFFEIATAKISTSESWDWPQLSFQKPYKTQWNGVVANGPFAIQFDTADLKNQEVGFELAWVNPAVDIGRFEIHDTIVRQIGGANFIIHLDGICNDMRLRIPAGDWKIKGTLRWSWTTQGLNVTWKNFAFAMAGSQPTVDIGQCQGPSGLHQELRNAIEIAAKDTAWMQDVMREGILDWVSGSMTKLQTELLKERVIDLRPGLTMQWRPTDMNDAGEGVLRIGGQMVFAKETAQALPEEVLARSYDVPSLKSVKESGFIMPRSTLQTVVNFMHKHGEIGYRVNSNSVDAFVSLMKSRFMQFFVWPDLMSFATDTQFYFDLRSESAPRLSQPKTLQGGGLQYVVESPLLVNQWAPADNTYVPYMDFRSPMAGTLSAKIQEGVLSLELQPGTLNVRNSGRKEFSVFRWLNEWIATSLLGSRVAEYIAKTPMKMEVKDWELGDGLGLGIRDVQIWKYSFRVPLDFKSPDQKK